MFKLKAHIANNFLKNLPGFGFSSRIVTPPSPLIITEALAKIESVFKKYTDFVPSQLVFTDQEDREMISNSNELS